MIELQYSPFPAQDRTVFTFHRLGAGSYSARIDSLYSARTTGEPVRFGLRATRSAFHRQRLPQADRLAGWWESTTVDAEQGPRIADFDRHTETFEETNEVPPTCRVVYRAGLTWRMSL